MALSKMSEVRELSDEALQKQIIDAKKQLFDLRFQKATRQLEKTHQFKHIRHRLAQLLTAERERQIEQMRSEISAEAVQEPQNSSSVVDAIQDSAESESEER